MGTGLEDDVLRFHSLRSKDDEAGCPGVGCFCLKSASNHVLSCYIWMI